MEDKDKMADPVGSENPGTLYIGTKMIKGLEMSEKAFQENVKGNKFEQENRPGYQVTYPDGYVSWSPKNVFENAYRELTDGEVNLLFSFATKEMP